MQTRSKSSRTLHKTSSVVVSICGLLAAGRANAEQTVAADVTYIHEPATTNHSHHYFKPAASTPANGKSPVDYTQGTVYLQAEIASEPTSEVTQLHACFFQEDRYYFCTTYSPKFTAPGTYRWSTKMAGIYTVGALDYAKIDQAAIILTDGTPKNVGPEDGGPTIAARFMPEKMRVVITLVSAGGTYVPPGPESDPGDAGTVADGPSVRTDGAIDVRSPRVSDAAAPTPVSTPDAAAPATPDSAAIAPTAVVAPTPTDAGARSLSPTPPGSGIDDPGPAAPPAAAKAKSGACNMAGESPLPAGGIVFAISWLVARTSRRNKQRLT